MLEPGITTNYRMPNSGPLITNERSFPKAALSFVNFWVI